MPMNTCDDSVELYFDAPPQSIAVRCWSDAFWNELEAKEEPVSLSGNTLALKDGGCIYEVTATWTGRGTAHYSFYVVKS